MAYDEGLAFRVESVMDLEPDVVCKKMFGGQGYLSGGNMACGVLEDYLIVRTGPEIYDECLTKDNVRVFDLTGRTMKGWIVVDSPGIEEDEDLVNWIVKGLSFARTLPVKA
jgi:TfoX/Sxy family transcriptional regulator of competence genes